MRAVGKLDSAAGARMGCRQAEWVSGPKDPGIGALDQGPGIRAGGRALIDEFQGGGDQRSGVAGGVDDQDFHPDHQLFRSDFLRQLELGAVL